jgi:hypothetical protein|tara:strand:+ start:36 stop:290 length:255 start_codon:yes stop_codon:yes gene_type:complete
MTNNIKDENPLMQMQIGDIMNLEMGEDKEERSEAMAVPGGWIFTRFSRLKDRVGNVMKYQWHMSSTFVPHPPAQNVIKLGPPKS